MFSVTGIGNICKDHICNCTCFLQHFCNTHNFFASFFPFRSGENDVEYGSNMDLEEGELMEDAAATAGASGKT